VDGHVHIHECFSLVALLDAARKNFQSAARELALPWPCGMVLMLTETATADYFGKLRKAADGRPASEGDALGTWHIEPTGEESSVSAVNREGDRILIVAGHQIVTREKLEVLALATTKSFPDNDTIDECIRKVQDAGGITVLPWGFGKWIGSRGRTVRRLIESSNVTCLHLGDNGGRLRYWPEPAEFRKAQAKNNLVLPGTDPLPFQGEEACVGSFGFALELDQPIEQPAAAITERLSEPYAHILPYGRSEKLLRFLRNQAKMQLLKGGQRQNKTRARKPG